MGDNKKNKRNTAGQSTTAEQGTNITAGQGTNNTGADDSLTCENCKVTFYEKDDALLQCDRCDKWSCLNCTSLTAEHYKLLNAKASKRLHWFCDTCDTNAMKAVKTDLDIETKCKEYMGTLRSEMKEIETNFDTRLKQEIGAVKREMNDAKETADKSFQAMKEDIESLKSEKASGGVENIQQLIDSKLQNLAEENLRELQDRENRKNNLIFYNITESPKAEAEQRINDDMEQIRATLDKLSIKVPLQKPIRLGTGNKPRPLRVTVTNYEDARLILKEARKLENINGCEKIFINRDMTPLERGNMRKLTERKKELNQKAKETKSGEVYIIKANKVVKKPVKKDATEGTTPKEVQEPT